MEELMKQLGSLGVSFSAMALDSGSDWPFVTLSSFQAQASHFLEQQTASRSLQLSVLVQDVDRDEWETYVITQSPQWINASYIDLGKQFPTKDTGTDFHPGDLTPYIYELEPENHTQVEASVDSYYAPVYRYMMSMAHTEEFLEATIPWINYNTLNETTYANIDAYLAEASTGNQNSTVVTTPPMILQEEDDLHSNNSTPSWPKSIFATALFDGFRENDRSRVATLSSQVSWHSFFEDVVQDGALQGPLVLAVEDTCGPSYMYEIIGSTVVYTESARDPILPDDELVFTSTLEELPLTKCSVILHLALSPELKEASSTNQPVIYTVAVLGIFSIMGIFFCVYDRLTGKSYHEAITKVERSKNIVESLFPSNVRDRLLNEKLSHGEVVSRRSNNTSHAEDEDGDLEDFLQKSRHGLHSKPIADLHPNVTVLFADIANFTVGSSRSIAFAVIAS